MNPDISSPEYQRVWAVTMQEERKEAIRRRELHDKALTRRRKAKRGGRR